MALAPDATPSFLWLWHEVQRDTERAWVVHAAQASPLGPPKPASQWSATLSSLGQVGAMIRADLARRASVHRWILGAEAVHVTRGAGGKANVKTAIMLAVNVGRVIGPLEAAAIDGVEFIEPAKWRKTLGVSQGRAEREALKADTRMSVGLVLPGWRTLVAGLDDGDAHGVDAAGIAVHRRGAYLARR